MRSSDMLTHELHRCARRPTPTSRDVSYHAELHALLVIVVDAVLGIGDCRCPRQATGEELRSASIAKRTTPSGLTGTATPSMSVFVPNTPMPACRIEIGYRIQVMR